jgi:hypothetical protein
VDKINLFQYQTERLRIINLFTAFMDKLIVMELLFDRKIKKKQSALKE